MNLNTPLKEAGRIYKMYSSRLEKLEIYKLEDFLYYLPFRYDDFSLISKIGRVQAGETVTIHGQVLSIENIFTKRFKKITKATISDGSGSIEAVWYNQTFLTKYIHVNDNLSLSGKAETFNNKTVLTSPDYELISQAHTGIGHDINENNLHTGRLVPIYPETKGVSSKWLRKQIFIFLNEFRHELSDFIPDNLLKKYSYPSLQDAIHQIHFPKNLFEAQKARERLAYNELFLLQLKSRQRKLDWQEATIGYSFSTSNFQKKIDTFRKSLPFTLTDSQSKSIHEILYDLTKDKPMNRLLQGDVGSGKTVVGAFAMYLAYLNGYQSVLMAPTEILAQQHYETIKQFLEPFGLKVALATGSKKVGFKTQDSRNKNRESKITHKPDFMNHKSSFNVLIGTHAILSSKIQFDKLGLVIVDEQQRFGVEQRSTIREKGINPHFLTMTATPIPRTVALTMYGDLDISYLSELPKNRKRIKTWLVPVEKRKPAYEWIRKQIKDFHSQIFIVCPFIEESETMQTVKAAKVEFERLKMDVFPDLRLTMLHGKQKAKEKEQVLTDFKKHEYDILVATPVVEVGIDIPNATVIIVEAAERFGLSQLHQMRGRVGRGEKQSYCLLFTESQSIQSIMRLKALETKHIGADLAELDLRLRGPGDIFGTAQSGLPKLKAANFSDFSLIQKTKIDAQDLFDNLNNFPLLEKKVKELTLSKVSPD